MSGVSRECSKRQYKYILLGFEREYICPLRFYKIRIARNIYIYILYRFERITKITNIPIFPSPSLTKFVIREYKFVARTYSLYNVE